MSVDTNVSRHDPEGPESRGSGVSSGRLSVFSLTPGPSPSWDGSQCVFVTHSSSKGDGRSSYNPRNCSSSRDRQSHVPFRTIDGSYLVPSFPDRPLLYCVSGGLPTPNPFPGTHDRLLSRTETSVETFEKLLNRTCRTPVRDPFYREYVEYPESCRVFPWSAGTGVHVSVPGHMVLHAGGDILESVCTHVRTETNVYV